MFLYLEGRIEGPNAENFTHGVYMRFQRKEDITKFYNSAFYSRVLEEHVNPISYVWPSFCM